MSRPLTHEPSINAVYENSRNERHLRLIYLDDELAVLRSEATLRDTDRHAHQFEDRGQFQLQLERDQLKHKPDADPDIPKVDPADIFRTLLTGMDAEGVLDILEETGHLSAIREELGEQKVATSGEKNVDATTEASADNGGSRSPSDVDTGDIAQIDAFTDSSDGDSDSDTDEDGPEAPTESMDESAGSDKNENGVEDGCEDDVDAEEGADWQEVPYLGPEAAQNLHERGYTTRGDIQQASDDDLIEIPLIGVGAIERLRKFATE
jgi:hypothetical protein